MTNVVFCADGTWNRPGTDDSADQPSYPTNVFKLFTNLAGKDSALDLTEADEQERVATDAAGMVTQIAKYLHGVGDSDNILVKLLGGAIGTGTIARIVRGYTFVSRNYVPTANIYLMGFSRGAYTVRALAGLVQARGLLDPTRLPLADDKGQAYRLAAAVWYDYQHERLAANWMEASSAALRTLQPTSPAFVATADRQAGLPRRNRYGRRLGYRRRAWHPGIHQYRSGRRPVSFCQYDPWRRRRCGNTRRLSRRDARRLHADPLGPGSKDNATQVPRRPRRCRRRLSDDQHRKWALGFHT